MTERTDTIAEFYQCNCASACDCEVDAREHMADSIAALRRELVSAYSMLEYARAERDDIIAICRGTQVDDAALVSMRKYVEQKLRLERELAEAKALVERAYREGLEDGPMWHDHAISPDVLWPASEVRKALAEL